MAKGQIRARVQCTIEIPVGTWGGGTTDLDALTKQVREEGAEIVRRMVKEKDGHLIGQPTVFFVVLAEEKQ